MVIAITFTYYNQKPPEGCFILYTNHIKILQTIVNPYLNIILILVMKL